MDEPRALAYGVGMIFGVAAVIFAVLALSGCVPSAPWQERAQYVPLWMRLRDHDLEEWQRSGVQSSMEMQLDQLEFNALVTRHHEIFGD